MADVIPFPGRGRVRTSQDNGTADPAPAAVPGLSAGDPKSITATAATRREAEPDGPRIVTVQRAIAQHAPQSIKAAVRLVDDDGPQTMRVSVRYPTDEPDGAA